MKTTIVGGEQPNTPAVSAALGTIGNSPIQVNGSAANDTGYLAFAGSGATATINANGNTGVVTLVIGAGIGPKLGAGAGDLFTVTGAHAYPSACYPVISAPNAAAVALVRNGYLTVTATGFTVSQPSNSNAALPAGSYAIAFNAPGA